MGKMGKMGKMGMSEHGGRGEVGKTPGSYHASGSPQARQRGLRQQSRLYLRLRRNSVFGRQLRPSVTASGNWIGAREATWTDASFR